MSDKVEETTEPIPPVPPVEETPPQDDRQIVIINNIEPPPRDLQIASRTVGLIGDIGENKAEEVLGTLLYMADSGRIKELADPLDPDSELMEKRLPIDMYISTYGGSVVDMFAIYDLMSHIKQEYTINTIGLGKVMSAGVLILAAGTKGNRKIGKNCRVMIHNVLAGYHGSLSSVKNEIKEVKWMQDRYIDCLQCNTKLSRKKIEKLLNKQMDILILHDIK